MNYKELSDEIYNLALKSWELCKEARKFENCRIMSLTSTILSGMSDMLLEAFDDLTSE